MTQTLPLTWALSFEELFMEEKPLYIIKNTLKDNNISLRSILILLI